MRGNPERYLRYAQTQASYKAVAGRERLTTWTVRMHLSSTSMSTDKKPSNGRSIHWKCIALPFSICLTTGRRLENPFAHKAFFQAVSDQTLRGDRKRPVDISPIVEYFEKLGSNDSMPLAELTKKLCWLLGLCGFLRPSDIERINLEESDWTSTEDSISLMIVYPKGKRLRQRIKKPVTIRSHSQIHLCPVAAFIVTSCPHAA
ncbi:hypothetical protein BGW37DRAFT_463295 [Umbelopsis sp. PMI_123]|nr:hypothetical protein BGW37DRAFT_463295 [Umbelopsis sp. PMI_123]